MSQLFFAQPETEAATGVAFLSSLPYWLNVLIYLSVNLTETCQFKISYLYYS